MVLSIIAKNNTDLLAFEKSTTGALSLLTLNPYVINKPLEDTLHAVMP
tara:strand:+ start:1337 stop:1480 length:144 start_codon:yes stop_codon:yes gene_type:complete